MDSTYTIGRLAKAAHVPVSTVRYYEQRGLLSPEQRSPSSYRIYGARSLHRLRFIRSAQGAGFTLEDIAHLLELRDGTGDPCGEVQVLIEHRLECVKQKLEELQRVQRVLEETVEWCRNPSTPGCCDVIAQLDEVAIAPEGTAPEGTAPVTKSRQARKPR